MYNRRRHNPRIALKVLLRLLVAPLLMIACLYVYSALRENRMPQIASYPMSEALNGIIDHIQGAAAGRHSFFSSGSGAKFVRP